MSDLPARRIPGTTPVSFAYRVETDGLRLVVSADSGVVATFDFALPQNDETDLDLLSERSRAGSTVHSRAGRGGSDTRADPEEDGDDGRGVPSTEISEWRTSIDHRPDGDGWLTAVRLDNLSAQTRALPPVGVGITVGDGWAGWSWASDVQGLILLSPCAGELAVGAASVAPPGIGAPPAGATVVEAPGGEPDAGADEVLVVRVRGFCRVAASQPVFAPASRHVDPALPVAYGVLHLANPTGSVAGFGRAASVLEFDTLESLGDAAGLLPDWLPELVVGEGEEIVFDTPDWAVVPGPDSSLTRDDTSMVLIAAAGHREVAIHATQGIHRLRATFAPGLGDLLSDVADPLLGRRPAALPSSAAVVVAGALLLSDADADRALDWLEREDWLARGDVFGCAAAALLAGQTGDAALARDTWERLSGLDAVRGRPLAGMGAWLACVALAGDAPGTASLPGGPDAWSRLESALLKNDASAEARTVLNGVINRLGADLPGQPLLLPEADAGYLIALLHLVPETWPERALATATSVKASALLLADHADGLQPGLDGLAWVTLANLAL